MKYEALRTSVLAALNAVDTRAPNPSWVRAADALKRASDGYSDLAVDMAVIEPPSSLKQPHAGLVKSLQLFSQLLDGLQSGLRSQDVATLQNVTNFDSSRVDELRGSWRVAATAEARRLGVAMPKRLTLVGRTP